MNWYTRVRLKVRDFFRKNKKIILVVVIAWAVIFAINYFLKNMEQIEVPYTTYEPNIAVMDESEVPKKLQEPINNLIDEYIAYCNNKDYESAYNLLDDSCKEYFFPNIEGFQKYIDSIFTKKKIHNVQNYSNLKNTYIYKVKILDDILASGLTDQEYLFYEEVMSITNENNKLKLGIYGFIRKEEMLNFVEDDNMKININSKVSTYETEVYDVTIKNKTEYIMVLLDDTETMEIELDLGTKTRKMSNTTGNLIMVYPKQTINIKLYFTKFVDDGLTSSKLKFNNIRILPSYSGDINQKQAEMDQAIKLYSLTIDL